MIWMETIKDIQKVYQQELQILDPQDIDIEAIAYLANATVRYRNLQGCEARIVGNGNRAVISVNRDTMRARQRFSIAHELGHWFCHRGMLGNLCSKEDITSSRKGPKKKIAGKEIIANRFASELLMPNYLYSKAVGSHPPTYDLIYSLSSSFQVSLTAAAIRCLDFCDYPAALVCIEGRRRTWFHTSPLFPNSYFPKLLISDIPLQSAGIMDADAWFDGQRLEYRSLNSQLWAAGDNCIMALLWWDEDWNDEA